MANVIKKADKEKKTEKKKADTVNKKKMNNL